MLGYNVQAATKQNREIQMWYFVLLIILSVVRSRHGQFCRFFQLTLQDSHLLLQFANLSLLHKHEFNIVFVGVRRLVFLKFLANLASYKWDGWETKWNIKYMNFSHNEEWICPFDIQLLRMTYQKDEETPWEGFQRALCIRLPDSPSPLGGS